MADALKTLQVTALVLVGCLNVKFVKTATLGSSVGETVNSTVHFYAEKLVKPFLPLKYWNIIAPTISVSAYSAAVYLAMFSDH